MRKLVTLMIVVILWSCATISLDQADKAQKHAAICLDAKTGVAMADAMLQGVLDAEARKYWTAFRTGCLVAMVSYCASTAPTEEEIKADLQRQGYKIREY